MPLHPFVWLPHAERAATVAGPKADTPTLNEDFIDAAANDLHYYTQGETNFDLSAYKRSFSEALARLKPADQPQLSQAVGANLASVMQSSLENPGFFQSGELAPLIVVAYLAGLDQAFADGFKQVCFLWRMFEQVCTVWSQTMTYTYMHMLA